MVKHCQHAHGAFNYADAMLQSCTSQIICQWENEPGDVPLRITLVSCEIRMVTSVISLIYVYNSSVNYQLTLLFVFSLTLISASVKK